MEIIKGMLDWESLKAETNARVGSESTCRAELPSADLLSLFYQIHPRWRSFTKIFYLKSSHRLKSISGTIIIIHSSAQGLKIDSYLHLLQLN